MKVKFWLMKYKSLLIVILITLVSIFILYLFNMRLTPLSALKANPFIGKDISVIEEIDIDWGKLYIVDTPEAFRTALVEKYGVLWNSSVSFLSDKEIMKQEQLKTIGYMSCTNSKQRQIQILAIWNEDPEVTTIHITREDGKVFTEPAPLNELILFKWDEVSNTSSMDILGLNKKDEALYQYGYPEGTTILRDSEFKWHPITD